MAVLLRLGTRASPLALAQAHAARDAICAACPDIDIELVEVTTRGDVDQRDLASIGERGLFVAELERALLDGDVDVAVHSAKDLRLDPPGELELAAFLPRDDARDVLCAAAAGPITGLDSLRPAARVATGSARRSALLRTVRPDVEAVPIRGNVSTRLERARERGDDALILAAAGLRRLGLDIAGLGAMLPVDAFVPDAGQGAVVVQARSDLRERLGVDLSGVDHAGTRWSVEVERAVAVRLGGGCARPVGVHVAGADGSHGEVGAVSAWAFISEAAGLPGAVHGAVLRREWPVAVAARELAASVGREAEVTG